MPGKNAVRFSTTQKQALTQHQAPPAATAGSSSENPAGHMPSADGPQDMDAILTKMQQGKPVGTTDSITADSSATEDCDDLCLLDPREASKDCVMKLACLLIRVQENDPCLANDLLECIRHKHFNHHQFTTRFKSMKDIAKWDCDRTHSLFEGNGFSKVNFPDGFGGQASMYVRDIVSVVSDQIRSVPNAHLYTNDSSHTPPTHPINAKVAREAHKLVKHTVQLNESIDVCWFDEQASSTTSFAGLVQLYTDKTQTSLKNTAMTFYPLHVTFLNFSEQMRREIIVSGSSIVAFLPSTSVSIAVTETTGVNIAQTKLLSRQDRLKLLHSAISFAVDPLLNLGFKGFASITKDGKQYNCHPILSSYIADIPEAKDIMSVKQGVKTSYPCFRCLVPRDAMKGVHMHRRRTNISTVSLYKKYDELNQRARRLSQHAPAQSRAAREQAQNLLNSESLHVTKPTFLQLPFISSHDYVDSYRVMAFEPLHNLHLGVSRLIKESFSARLRDHTLVSTAVDAKKKSRTFPSLRAAILRTLNMFLRDVATESTGFNLNINFAKTNGTDAFDGLFKDHGLVGMLEGKDYKCIDQVAPFFGAIADRLCGEIEDAPITSIFTMYTDMMQMVLRLRDKFVWGEEQIADMKQMIHDFKTFTVDILCQYQASEFCTLKWHLLDHIPNDLRDYGGLEVLDAGLYEHAHTIPKRAYSDSSKRHSTAFSESIMRLRIRDAVVDNKDEVSKKLFTQMQEESAVLANDGVSVMLIELLKVHKLQLKHNTQAVRELDARVFKNTPDLLIGNKKKVVSDPLSLYKYLYDVIGIEGIASFFALIKEQIQGDRCNHNSGLDDFPEADVTTLQIVRSCRVSGYDPPSLSDTRNGSGLVFLPHTNQRYIQKIVASNTYYNTGKKRYDNVMVESDQDNDDRGMGIWFGHTKVLMRITTQGKLRPGTHLCLIHNRDNCSVCDDKKMSELAFIQYYDILPRSQMDIDSIEERLNCIRVSWARDGEECHGLDAGKMFGLVPIDSIRGVCHMVRMNSALSNLAAHNKLVQQLQTQLGQRPGWATEWFYVNRFLVTPGFSFKVGRSE